MEHLLESIGLMQNGTMLPGFIFGFVHVGLVLLGFYSGWSINRLLKMLPKVILLALLELVLHMS